MTNPLALINIAKTQLGMDDDDYRALLKLHTGKDSLRKMSHAERMKIVGVMESKGFKRQHKGNFKPSNKAYVRQIFALWKSCKSLGVVDDGNKTALRSFVQNMTGISDPEFLTYQDANPVIEALKKMEKRGQKNG